MLESVVTAVVSVTWSSLVPPTIVSTFVTVTMLAKLPSVSLSEPEWRSIVVLEAIAPSVIVSLPEAAEDALDVQTRLPCCREC